MAYLGFDAGFPSSPGQVVADMRASGARLIGLYVYNSSVPGAVVSASFMAAVEQLYGAPCVLPIVTIASGDNPSASTVASALSGRGMAGRRVGHDIETYAFPTIAELIAVYAGERALGCSPGEYGVESTLGSYAAAGPDWVWDADWTGGFHLNSGRSMTQYADNWNGNTTYDVNAVDDAFSVMVASPHHDTNIQPDVQQQVLILRS